MSKKALEFLANTVPHLFAENGIPPPDRKGLNCPETQDHCSFVKLAPDLSMNIPVSMALCVGKSAASQGKIRAKGRARWMLCSLLFQVLSFN